MLHFVFGASPQRFLCHFPNKIASFPQQLESLPQQLVSLPQHIFSFPQQLCVILLPTKKTWFFLEILFGVSYLNITGSLWRKLKLFEDLNHIVVSSWSSKTRTWHCQVGIWSSSNFVLRRIFLCWFHRQYHWPWPGDRQLDLSHQDLTWCSCRQEMRKRNPVFTCRRLGLLYFWQYFLQHIALQRSRSSLERLSIRRKRWSVMQRWISTTAHLPLISRSPPAHLTTLSFPSKMVKL